MAKRESPPPFEIMRGGPAPGTPGTPGKSGNSEKAVGLPRKPRDADGPASYGWFNWGLDLRQPVVLRLPIAVLVAVLVLLILTVLGAYWVGQRVGDAAARGELADMQRTLPTGGRGQTGGLVPAGGSGASGASGDLSTGGASGTGAGTGQLPDNLADPRVIGMNYFILARYPREEALRLVAFLRQNGVASMALPTDNARLYLVVDRQGFTPEQVRGEAYEQRMQELKRLGRLWKSAHNGPSDLSDLYGRKHTG